jgi:lipopolysaccharide transport system ATP-binding protein
VGTGFHPELTGRENVFLNGSILGITRKEIDRKFDEIVAFSGVEKFIDTPVKRYSSGMFVRLAFAVAAHLEPDILLLDEVLSVGDAAFQAKCLGKMSDVAREGRTVVFISHNMHAVRSLCTRSILLDEGRVLESGATESVISRYLLESTGAAASSSLHRTWGDIQTAPGNDKIRLHKVQLIPDTNDLTIRMDTPIRIEIEYWSMLPNTKMLVQLCLYSLDGSPVFDSMTAYESEWDGQQFPRGLFRSTCWIPGNLLNEGNYRMRIAFNDDSARSLYDQGEALVFAVHDSKIRDIPWYGRFIGFVHPKLEWKTQLVQLEDEHALA